MKKPFLPHIALYLILIVLSLVAMDSLKNCSANSGVIEEKAAGGDTIDVCIEYSPLSCYMYNDTVGGFEYDLIRMVGKRGGLNLKFHNAVTLQKGLNGLDDGRYKILVARFPVTNESRDKYIFTDAIYLDSQVLVQREDSLGNVVVRNQLDLAGKTIHVVKDSPMENRLHALSHEIGDTIYIREEKEYSSEQLFLMVASGVIDYAVVNTRDASNYAKGYPGINTGTKISFTQFQSWTLPMNQTELRDSLNVWISDVKKTGEYKKLYNRYF